MEIFVSGVILKYRTIIFKITEHFKKHLLYRYLIVCWFVRELFELDVKVDNDHLLTVMH